MLSSCTREKRLRHGDARVNFNTGYTPCQTPRCRACPYSPQFISPAHRSFSEQVLPYCELFRTFFRKNLDLANALVKDAKRLTAGFRSAVSLASDMPGFAPGVSRRRDVSPDGSSLYAFRSGAATCFLRERTPGIQVPPCWQVMPKVCSTISGLPSTMNWLPSAMMSVTSSSTNS